MEKKGKWLPLSDVRAWECSECHTIGRPRWNWCPVCGAKMKERKEE